MVNEFVVFGPAEQDAWLRYTNSHLGSLSDTRPFHGLFKVSTADSRPVYLTLTWSYGYQQVLAFTPEAAFEDAEDLRQSVVDRGARYYEASTSLKRSDLFTALDGRWWLTKRGRAELDRLIRTVAPETLDDDRPGHGAH